MSTMSTEFKPKKSVALSGVAAGSTALCTVGNTGNDLYYRGYDILEFAEKAEFEEIAYLIVHGELPNKEQLKAYKAKLRSFRDIPEGVKIEATARKAVEYYRERYSTTGIFENRPYPGVEKMLQELRRKKYLLAVASSKPEYYVKQILDYFNLTEYFDEIVGSEMNGARTNKTEVIEETLKRLGLDHHREQVIMVGDKEHDVLGARKAGLDCVAVSYGYGTEEELAASQPLQIVASAEEILDFFA